MYFDLCSIWCGSISRVVKKWLRVKGGEISVSISGDSRGIFRVSSRISVSVVISSGVAILNFAMEVVREEGCVVLSRQ